MVQQTNGKVIVEDIWSHYRLKGDEFWYVRGNGPDTIMFAMGPGPNPKMADVRRRSIDEMIDLLNELDHLDKVLEGAEKVEKSIEKIESDTDKLTEC